MTGSALDEAAAERAEMCRHRARLVAEASDLLAQRGDPVVDAELRVLLDRLRTLNDSIGDR